MAVPAPSRAVVIPVDRMRPLPLLAPVLIALALHSPSAGAQGGRSAVATRVSVVIPSPSSRTRTTPARSERAADARLNAQDAVSGPVPSPALRRIELDLGSLGRLSVSHSPTADHGAPPAGVRLEFEGALVDGAPDVARLAFVLDDDAVMETQARALTNGRYRASIPAAGMMRIAGARRVAIVIGDRSRTVAADELRAIRAVVRSLEPTSADGFVAQR